MSKALIYCAAAVVALGAADAAAQSAVKAKTPSLTGVDSIHAQVRLGNKVCMADHDHQGEATMPTRRGAESAAIRAWQIFTRDEYGSSWGSYTLAVAKTMRCNQSGGRWSCHVSARPCRPAKL